jgi:hypothetical protein
MRLLHRWVLKGVLAQSMAAAIKCRDCNAARYQESAQYVSKAPFYQYIVSCQRTALCFRCGDRGNDRNEAEGAACLLRAARTWITTQLACPPWDSVCVLAAVDFR